MSEKKGSAGNNHPVFAQPSTGTAGFKSHPRRFRTNPLHRISTYPKNRAQRPLRNNQLRAMDAQTELQTLNGQVLPSGLEVKAK
ncbi:MAG: hypothetical protein ABSE39_01235 [Candidatus Bathyarchaeia archaeon]